MPVDLLLAAISLFVFVVCAFIWKQRRELLRILNAPLRSEVGGDVVIGTVTALDVLQGIVRNAPGLVQHLDHLDHFPDPHALLSVDEIVTPHAISSAVAAGDMTNEHIAFAAAHAHGHALDAAHAAATHADLAAHGIAHLGSATHALDLNPLHLTHAGAHIPITSLLVKGWQNWEKVEAGHLSGAEWAAHTAGGVASTTAGALVGKGFGVGMAAAALPVLGPVAILAIPLAVIGGAVAGGGVFTGIKKWWYGDALRRAEAALKEAQAELAGSYALLRKKFLSCYRAVRRAARKQHRKQLAETRRELHSHGSFLRRLVRPTLLTVGLEEVIRRSKRDFANDTLGYYAKLLREMQRQTAEEGGRLLFNHGKQFFLGVRAIDAAYDRTQSAANSFERRQSVYYEELRALQAKL